MSAFSKHKIAAVVVTGGSSGIGAAFIAHLSALKRPPWICNLSRREPPNFSQTLGRHHPVDLVNPLTLADTAVQVRHEIEENTPPGAVILINNSGFGSYGDFADMDVNRQLEMIDLNVRAVVDLTGRLLPLLFERGEGGGVINIASTASFQPCPTMATYGATKAFLRSWSLALAEELRPKGLNSLCVCPGPTRTDFFRASAFNNGNELPGQMTAEAVVKMTWKAWNQRRKLLITGHANRILASMSGAMPSSWSASVAARVLRSIRTSKA